MGFTEKFSYLFDDNGKFQKFLKVLYNEELNKIWIDIRLFYMGFPTKHGVTLIQLEYMSLTELVQAIQLKSSNEVDIKRSNDPSRELRLRKLGDFLWVLELNKTVPGISKQIKISVKDIAKLYKLDHSGDKLYEEYCSIKTDV